MTNPPRQCRNCGALLDDSSAPGGLCAVCLLTTGLAPEPAPDAKDRGHVVLPHVFGSYVLIEELGRGGMGVVYATRQPALDRMVAVKLLLHGAYASEAALERFRREAAAAAGLQHPNIVEIHDYGEWEGQPYYAMDLIAGSNLAQVCDGRPLGAKRAATILRDLADAVHYAHQQGVLHRDLKPSNVLMDDRDRPRITDFGLARRVGDDSGVTQSGMIMGSPGYASPEQAGGRIGEVGVRSDVYGLGAILYHLLTGRAPFNAATPTETLRLVLETEPPAPRLLNPAVPRDLETICLRCLAKELTRRYASAAQVGEELRCYLEHRPICARPPSVIYRTRKFVRRYRTGVAAVAMIVVALAVGLMLALLGYQRAVEQQLATDAARARSQEMVTFIMQKSLPDQLRLGRREAMIESAEMAVRYFERLPADLNDRETMRAHATALDLLQQAHGSTVFRWTNTDPVASHRAAAHAASLWRQLAATDGTDANAAAAAIFDEYLALRGNINDLGRGLEASVEKLLVECRTLELRFPENDAVQRTMVTLLFHQAMVPGTHGKTWEAVARGQEARRRVERMLARRPGDWPLRDLLAGAYGAEANAHLQNRNWEAGMRSMEAGMAIANDLLAEDPGNLQFLQTATNMALRLLWCERVEIRMPARVKTARDHLAALMALDPEDPEWRYLDALALSMQAVTAMKDRLHQDALESVKLALVRWASLPDESFDRLPLQGAIGQAGSIAATAGDSAEVAAMSKRLYDEFGEWARDGDSPYGRSLRRFYFRYALSTIALALRDWVALEHQGRQMLAEADGPLADVPDVPLGPNPYRAGALAMLGKAWVEQGRVVEAVPLLREAVRRFQSNTSLAPFYEFPLEWQWVAAEDLARALGRMGERSQSAEVLEWAVGEHDSQVKLGGLLESRVALAQCAWQLAQALDPDVPVQAARRREVLTRALEMLDDPETSPRLTREERDLRAKVAEALSEPVGT